MNKIIINDFEQIKEIDNSIEYQITDDYIKKIKIKILKNTELKLIYNITKEAKYKIIIEVAKNIKFKLFEQKQGNKIKIQYCFNFEENAKIDIYKFNNTKEIKENIIFNLNGENIKLNYIFKTISKCKEKYDIVLYHNGINTTSEIKNNGVNIENGELIFNVSGFIPKGVKNCSTNQINKIINLTDNKCVINPNLYIDEFDVSANHSAYIGDFNKDEMFYLKSRGIKEKEAKYLLVKGFLLGDFDIEKKYLKEIENQINQYWR